MAGDYTNLRTTADDTVSASDGLAASLSDSAEFSATAGLMVTTAGNLAVTWAKTGRTSTIPGLLAGVVYPFQVTQVRNSNTTATGVFLLYN
jgi:hypothetical protein